MILGTGIDAVEIARFADWHTRPRTSLKKLFSDEEIEYCLSDVARSAERFAVRFAAREAVYKITHAILELTTVPFLTLAQVITIAKSSSGAPYLTLDWQKLSISKPPHIVWHLSLTHSETIAIASVIAEQRL
jgi:holo-[acyl-carrier protein] synthase